MEKTAGSLFTNANVIKFFDREDGSLKNRFQERLPQVSLSHFPPYLIRRGLYMTLIKGERIVVTSTFRNFIYIFDKNGRLINKVVTDRLIDHAPVKLKEGRSLAVSQLGTVYVINQDGALLNKFKTNRFPGGFLSFLPMSDGGVVIDQGNHFYFVNEEGILKNEAKIGKLIPSKAKLTGSGVAILDGFTGEIYYFDQYRRLKDVIRLKLKEPNSFRDIAFTSTDSPVAALGNGEVAFFDKRGNTISRVLLEEGAWKNVSLMSNKDVVMLALKNYIYFLNENGKIIKLNKIDGGMKSPPIIVNDQVVVVSDDGYLYAFDQDGEIRNRLGHGHIERILNVNNSTITVLSRRETGDSILFLEVR